MVQRSPTAINWLSWVLALVFFAGAIQPAAAVTRTVTSSLDSGAGSLRTTMAAAVAGDVIVFNTSSPIVLTSPISIAVPVTISGPGANLLTISGNNITRIFDIPATVPTPVTITGVTLQNGLANATALRGGAISNAASLVLDGVVLKNNAAFDGGGAIYNVSASATTGQLRISNSQLSGNSVSDASGIGGGAILSTSSVGSAATVTIINSTITGNTANASSTGMVGGGINFANGALKLFSSTVASNNAGIAGGNIHQASVVNTSLTLRNSIVSGGVLSGSGATATDIDIFQPGGATINSLGYNIVTNRSAGTGYLASDAVNGTLPILGTLAANGGPTQTMVPQAMSPATGFVPLAACLDDAGTALVRDQRGVPRQVSGATACDAGATEASRLSIPTTLPNGIVGVAYSQTLTLTGGLAPYTFSLVSGAFPAGISLAGGVISGTPTTVGSSTFTIGVTDQTGATATRAYTVSIALPTYTLTVNLAGTGAGGVTGSGLSCAGAACSGTYSAGTNVVLTAFANAQQYFAGWSGAACTGSGACSLTINANTTVNATFAVSPPLPVGKPRDLSGDGKSDIVWQRTDGSSAVWFMNGINLISGAGLMGPGTGWSIKAVADFNGDGKADIVWQHTDGSSAVWLMDGANLIAGAGLVGAGSGWTVAGIGDFNGDGKADIVWQHTDGRSAVWLMDGVNLLSGGGFVGAGSGWNMKAIADFNGDGKCDIVWQHTDGSSAIWLMNGINLLAGGGLLGPGTGWNVKTVGDFNGDGKADIIWQHTDGSNAVWLMNGLNLVSGGGLTGAGSGWSVVATGDLNGDGKTDIIWQHTDGSSAAWLMNGAAIASGAGLLGAGSGWSFKATGDFNGDGKADIIWQRTDGSSAVWLMNGLTLTSGAGLLGAGSGWSPVP